MIAGAPDGALGTDSCALSGKFLRRSTGRGQRVNVALRLPGGRVGAAPSALPQLLGRLYLLVRESGVHRITHEPRHAHLHAEAAPLGSAG